MRGYTVIFDYGPPGGERKRFTIWVKARNKAEAALRAGARFTQETGNALPPAVQGISITGRSLHGWS